MAVPVALVAALPLFSQGQTSLRHADVEDSFASGTCAVCHPAAYEQWRISRHAQSGTNAIFAVSAAHFQRPWCFNCHAPMESASEGVSCAACHVREGTILSASEPTAAAARAHPMRHEPALADASFCAGCHQFPFPDRHALDRGEVIYTSRLLQRTYSEWRRSDSERSCHSCHMKGGAHLFPGAHDEAFVRDALAVNVQRESDTVVVAEIRAKKTGHHAPTGDPFRRLVLTLCSDPQCTDAIGTAHFQRTFEGDRLSADTTVPATGARVVRLALSRAAVKAIFYRLDYFFGDSKLEPALGPSDVSFLIASGQAKGSP